MDDSSATGMNPEDVLDQEAVVEKSLEATEDDISEETSDVAKDKTEESAGEELSEIPAELPKDDRSRKERLYDFLRRYRMTCIFGLISFVLILFIIMLATQLHWWKEESRVLEKNLEVVKQQQSDNDATITTFQSKKSAADKKVADLDKTIAELNDIKEQIKQGASYQITLIQDAYDAEEWQKVIDLTAKLHEEHPDAPECTAADELAATAQAKLDEIAKAKEEEEARKKAEEEEKARQKEEQEAAKAQQDEEKKKLNSLKNKDMLTVLRTVDEMGYTATFYNQSFAWMGEKGTAESRDIFNSEAYPEQDLIEFWKATKIYNINVINKTVDIDYIGEEPGTVNPGDTAGLEKQQKQLQEKLDIAMAWVALENYGKQLYPYGFTAHYLFGPYVEEVYDNDTWYLRTSCTIKNEYNAKGEFTVEAKVTGTTNSPKVFDFNVF